MLVRLSAPDLGPPEFAAVEDVLRSGMIAQGKKVESFENEFAAYVGTKHAVAVSNGTAALSVALASAGVGQGQEVITSPFTFAATANSILHCGATPVFVDIDERTFNIDPALLEESVTEKTAAILPVHIFGQPADMDGISGVAGRHGLMIIEDAAQAHGAESNGKRTGSFGKAGCFSFYATKNMTTGEGGMITTDDQALAKKAAMLRNHGQESKYFHTEVGWNCRMTDFQAAIGLVQLRKLDSMNEARARNAIYLNEGLSGYVDVPSVSNGVKHVWHLYSIMSDKRDAIASAMRKADIETSVCYPTPLHKQPSISKGRHFGSLPVVEKVCKRILSLPVHPCLQRADLDEIIRVVRRTVG